jgi:hypothetical protein
MSAFGANRRLEVREHVRSARVLQTFVLAQLSTATVTVAKLLADNLRCSCIMRRTSDLPCQRRATIFKASPGSDRYSPFVPSCGALIQTSRSSSV